MRYISEICAGCSLVFGEADDIVVCPECGTPQHRACWKDGGGCANASLHEGGFVWKSAAQPEAPAFDPSASVGRVCPVCGTNNPPGETLCGHCDARLDAAPSAASPRVPAAAPGPPSFVGEPGFADETIGGVRAGDIAVYTQLSARRYIEKFRRLAARNKKLGWNWAAFFLSPYWFFYRKLYWLGGIFVGLTLAIQIFFAGPLLKYYELLPDTLPTDITQEFLNANWPAFRGLYTVFLAFAGVSLLAKSVAALVADKAYKDKVYRDITSLRKHAGDENVFRFLAVRRGGASPLAFLACFYALNLLFRFLIDMTVWL